jgi:hypothetical protein
LTLDYDHYTSREIKDVSDGALHLYTRHQAKNAYKEQELQEKVAENNPLAVLRCIYETTTTNAKSKLTHLNKTFNMIKTMLCRDAMVEITKVNIEHNWGLFNGTIGTTHEGMEWEAGDQKTKCVPVRLKVHGLQEQGKVLVAIPLPVT